LKFEESIPLNEILSINPDLILLDHVLPKEPGGDYCKRIKTNKETTHIPVIIISANMNVDRIANNACADGYVAKPFDIDELVSTIEKLTT